MTRYYNSGDFKRMAREALKDNLLTVFIAFFLAAVPFLLVNWYTHIQSESLRAMQVEIQALDSISMKKLIGYKNKLQFAQWSGWLLWLVAFLLTPALELGVLATVLKRLRGEEITYNDMFSRLGCTVKGIGLTVMVSLKTLVWSLPGIVPIFIIVSLVTGLSIDQGSQDSIYGLFGLIIIISVILMIVLGIRASLHYSLAYCVMADKPSIGVMDAIRESVSLMRYRKMQLVKLYLSFFLWIMLFSVVSGVLLGLLGNLSTVIVALLSLMLNAYMETSKCAFYHVYRAYPSQKPEAVLLEVDNAGTGDVH